MVGAEPSPPQPEGLLEERQAGQSLYSGLLDIDPSEPPRFKNTGNTNIIWHAGKLLALLEAALPTRLEMWWSRSPATGWRWTWAR